MKRWRVVSIVLAVLLTFVVMGTTASNPYDLPSSYTIPGEAVFPEGIAVHPTNGYFYVGSTNGGTIYRGHISTQEMEPFLPGGEDGRVAALGMDIDSDSRLFIAGGPTNMIWVYNARTGVLLAALSTGNEGGFVNDVIINESGDAYATDSYLPYIYRISEDDAGNYSIETWLDVTDSVIEYQEGFNLNGIVSTYRDEFLIVVQTNTGKLFRVDIASKDIAEIDLGGASVANGDGLALSGNFLWVVRNFINTITTVKLANDFGSGEIFSNFTGDQLNTPTTAARSGTRLLIVNSQFANQAMPTPPFTVSAIPRWDL